MPAQDAKLKAFVLMPFDLEFDAIFKDLIKPALDEVGYTVTRADSIANQQNILKDIIRGIAEADLVIADLTSLNANVFYEIGISHTLRRPTVLLCQSTDDIPFDLKAYRVIPYSVHFKEARELSKKLKDIGEQAKCGDLGFGNPVTDFLPHSNRDHEPHKSENKIAVVSECETKVQTEFEEKGLWDFIVDNEKTVREIHDSIDRLSKATQENTENLQWGTQELAKIAKSGSQGMASKIHKHATNVASKMNEYSQNLENEEPILRKAWESFDENTSGLIKYSRILSKDDKDAAVEIRLKLGALHSAIQLSRIALQKNKESTIYLKGISKDMNRASKRLVAIMEFLISDLLGAESFCLKSLTLLDEKVDKESKNINVQNSDFLK